MKPHLVSHPFVRPSIHPSIHLHVYMYNYIDVSSGPITSIPFTSTAKGTHFLVTRQWRGEFMTVKKQLSREMLKTNNWITLHWISVDGRMWIDEQTDVRMYIHTCVCMHVHVCMYVCMNVYVCTCTMYVCMYRYVVHVFSRKQNLCKYTC